MKSKHNKNMSKCDYFEVPKCEATTETVIEEHTDSWSNFFRQVLVCSGIWSISFQCGLIAGTPTVLIPQMRREANCTDIISQEQASWISSITVLTASPWAVVISAIAWYFGRRAAHAFVAACSLAAYTSLYFSTMYKEIFISMIIFAIPFAAQVSIGLLIMPEYTSPENRGFFFTLKSATFYWGMWVANTIGTFLPWRNIAVVGFCCAAFNMLTLLAWPESPYWLASRGRMEECRNSFLWSRKCNKQNETELNHLMELNKNCHIRSRSVQVKELWENVCSKWFYKSLFLCILATSQYYLSGKRVISVYVIDIIKNITHSDSGTYTGMLILDGVTVFGMYCGCFLARRLKRRVQLILGASGGIVCMMFLSLYMYVVKHSYFSENYYLSLSLLSISTLFISCGPVMLSITLVGELLPMRQRSFCAFIMATYIFLLSGLMLKTAPQLFAFAGIDGTFLFYSVASTICLIVLCQYMPETKDMTLLEISKLVVERH